MIFYDGQTVHIAMNRTQYRHMMKGDSKMNDDKTDEVLVSVKALSNDIDNLVSVLEQIADKFDRHNELLQFIAEETATMH